MGRPSDNEYKLLRKIKDLETQIVKKDTEIEHLRKRLDKIESSAVEFNPKVKKKNESNCPLCNSIIKVSDLPFGKLKLCSAACGWRLTTKD